MAIDEQTRLSMVRALVAEPRVQAELAEFSRFVARKMSVGLEPAPTGSRQVNFVWGTLPGARSHLPKNRSNTKMSNEALDDLRMAMIRDGVPQQDLAKAAEAQEQTWDTKQLQEDFEVLGFLAPFVIVRRKADDVKGSLEFTHSPRVYFNWTEE